MLNRQDKGEKNNVGRSQFLYEAKLIYEEEESGFAEVNNSWAFNGTRLVTVQIPWRPNFCIVRET